MFARVVKIADETYEAACKVVTSGKVSGTGEQTVSFEGPKGIVKPRCRTWRIGILMGTFPMLGGLQVVFVPLVTRREGQRERRLC